MAKYMFQASYTLPGLKGLLKDGGTKRMEVISQMCEGMGGRLESFYYAFGGNDAYVVADLPDNVNATAAALTVAAGGGATVKTVVLITPEEVDKATKQSVSYSPPGQ